MIIDSMDQDGGHAGTVCSQRVRINLIPHQSRMLRCDAISVQAFPNALGSGFPGPQNAGQAIHLAKLRNPPALAVGYDAHSHIRSCHGSQPPGHLLRGDICGVGNDGIIKIQHQEPNIPLGKQFRRHIRQCIEDYPG